MTRLLVCLALVTGLHAGEKRIGHEGPRRVGHAPQLEVPDAPYGRGYHYSGTLSLDQLACDPSLYLRRPDIRVSIHFPGYQWPTHHRGIRIIPCGPPRSGTYHARVIRSDSGYELHCLRPGTAGR